MTREDWLNKATDTFRAYLFKENQADIPAVKVSTGFPAGSRGIKTKKIGQFIPPNMTADGVGQIYISPVIEEPVLALATLIHELCHAVYPTDQHGPLFGKLARAVGLAGPLTQTHASDALKKELESMAAWLGPYPHSAVDYTGLSKQETRMIKVYCPDCGYIARVSHKWLKKIGTPLCRCNKMPMIAENEEKPF